MLSLLIFLPVDRRRSPACSCRRSRSSTRAVRRRAGRRRVNLVLVAGHATSSSTWTCRTRPAVRPSARPGSTPTRLRRAVLRRRRRPERDDGAAHGLPVRGRDAGLLERRRCGRASTSPGCCVLETAVMGVFVAQDLILFFLFWELRADADVLPDLDLGDGTQRVLGDEVRPLHAGRQSALMLVGFLVLGFSPGTFDMEELAQARHHQRGDLAERGVLPDPGRLRDQAAGDSRCTPGCPTPTRTRRRRSA